MTTIGPIMFRSGDRICWKSKGEDGLPVRRYGFVNGRPHRNGRVVVMFDGDLKGETTVATTELQPVSIMTIDLIIDDLELLNDPTLRQALVGLWESEVDLAGLVVEDIVHLGTGVRDVTGPDTPSPNSTPPVSSMCYGRSSITITSSSAPTFLGALNDNAADRMASGVVLRVRENSEGQERRSTTMAMP